MVIARWSASESERGSRPVLLLLHGHGLDESTGWELRHFLPPEVVVVSVRAPRDGPRGYSWFDLDPTRGPDQANAAVADLCAWVDEELADQAVGVMGFSQGGAAAAQLFRAAPERFDYLAVLAGFVIPGAHPGDAVLARRRPPVLWSHGREDQRIPSPLVDSTRAYLIRHSTLDERVYDGLAHGVSLAQLSDLRAFVARHALSGRRHPTAVSLDRDVSP